MPDGHTLGLVVSTTLTVNPNLYKKVPFDPDKDFRLISIVTASGNMLVVHPSVPVHSVAEFVAYAKAVTARQEPISYASAGNGTPSHLTMEYFRMHAGFDAIHVPYRSVAPMVVDLVSGQVKAGFVATSSIDHVRAGRLRGLAVSHAGRSPLVRDLRTIAESGYPGFAAEALIVLLAPAGIPETITALLEREVQAALKLPDVIEQFRAMDARPVGIIGPEVGARLKVDREAWAKVVSGGNIQLD
jgi:tripartite-type tricarboxylate transporter receptor subunit TctC